MEFWHDSALDPSLQADVLVLGGGAAGLMCAIEAGKRGRRVTVLEHNAEVGRKILISGGGRCNFTNIHTRPENFISANPHFAKSALARYRPADFIALVERHRIPYHEKTLGQLFCDRSARDITRLLEAECARAGARIVVNCKIRDVRRSAEFVVEAETGTYSAAALVVATGGLTIPKMGATPLAYRLADQFGLRILETRPALVPLVFSSEDRNRYCDLAGVAADVEASAGGVRFRERMLITHRGLSGPAVLQASSYWVPGQEMAIDLLPGVDFAATLRERKVRRDRAETRTILGEFLPHRLADRWFELHGPSRPALQAGEAEIAALDRNLHAWKFRPDGTEGYSKAEVTAGGVDTRELSSRTMEAQQVRGLFFVGEAVDVTGHLGGFNFQWAWASGYSAGQAV
jgi:predicted Rossmann fold flavoprotein